ncbi:MAG: chemotaxis protein CheA [Desulfobulbaceae bacterium]|nr:chemotaxis protein CheA [Desulfobulbaceae bacterium]
MTETNLSADQIEIIQDFIQESREMIDTLEPTIIELGESCQKINCWEALGCSKTDCPCHGREIGVSCWLEAGFVGDGKQTCPYATSSQECLDCAVFRQINGDRETMNSIFRLFHSMKGSAGFLDLTHIQRAAHSAENLLDLIRNGKIEMVPEHVDLLCRSCDFAKAALDHLEEHFSDEAMAQDAETIASQLLEAIELGKARAMPTGAVTTAPQSPAAPPPSETAEPVVEDPQAQKRAAFILDADDLLQKIEEELKRWTGPLPAKETLAELSHLVHGLRSQCELTAMVDMERLCGQMEMLLDNVAAGTTIEGLEPPQLLAELNTVLHNTVSALAEGGDGRIANLELYLNKIYQLLHSRLGDLLVDRGLVNEATLEQALQQQEKPPLGKILTDMGAISTQQLDEVITEQKVQREEIKKSAPAAPTQAAAIKRQDIRVDLEKLDSLINIIGEIVITENIVLFNPDLRGLELDNFNKAGAQLSKLVRELQELAMTIRMVPVSGLFRKMMRLVHDLGVKSGKKVELKLIGEETELDKTVIEMITDPLVHLLRNSIDHGIETPQERKLTGKPEKGTIVLSASHKEGEVWITLEDDGKGLNKDKILAKAISRGLIQGDGSELSPSALTGLIFQAGFSTADKITEISGRGVGLDVVRQNIEKISGKIEVNSTTGEGTRFDLRIPLTLGIIDGMRVRVGKSRCIMPTLSIRESFCPQEEMIRSTPGGHEIVRVRDLFYTVIRLHEVLGHQPDSTKLSDGILILLSCQENNYCLFVDEILGQQPTVIKGLPDFLGQVPSASGCTILDDGQVCLILDIAKIISTFENSNRMLLRDERLAAAQRTAN